MIDAMKSDLEKSNDTEINIKKTHPRAKFTQSEDELLIQLVENFGTNDWQSISHQMPGRNSRQCRDRWQNYLSPDVVNGPWTPEEEELLVKKYEELGPSWKQIATFFPTRTDINIKSRWHLRERRLKKEDLQMKKALLRKKIGPMPNPAFHQSIYHPAYEYMPQMRFMPRFPQINNIVQPIVKSFPVMQQPKKKNIQIPAYNVATTNIIPAINSDPLPFFSQKVPTETGNENELNISSDEIFDSATSDCMNFLLMNEDNNVFDSWF